VAHCAAAPKGNIPSFVLPGPCALRETPSSMSCLSNSNLMVMIVLSVMTLLPFPTAAITIRSGQVAISNSSSEMRIPFYVYPAPDYTKHCKSSTMELQYFVPEVALERAVVKHPWRVENPADASLFFVPAYKTHSSKQLCGNHSKNMESLAAMLRSSPWFASHVGRQLGSRCSRRAARKWD